MLYPCGAGGIAKDIQVIGVFMITLNLGKKFMKKKFAKNIELNRFIGIYAFMHT